MPFYKLLYRVAYRLTGNAQDAEDLLQDTYLKLWQKRDELADEQSLNRQIDTRDEAETMEQLIRQLPERDGNIVQMHLVEGRTHDEIEQDTARASSSRSL